MSVFKRGIVLVADGNGCGGAPDAAQYGYAGADTLGTWPAATPARQITLVIIRHESPHSSHQLVTRLRFQQVDVVSMRMIAPLVVLSRLVNFRLGIAIVAAAVVLAHDADARADVRVAAGTQAPPVRRVVFEGQMGGHAPLGQFGFAIDADVVPWLSLTAGVGMDSRMTNNDYFNIAPRLVLMPRARLAIGRWERTAAGAGIGIVYGERADQVGAASRVIGDLSLEHQSLGGVRVRAFAGLGALLGPAAPQGGAGHKAWRPHVGLALGYAFAPNPTVMPEDSLSIHRWYGWQGLALDTANAAILGLWQGSDYDSRGTALRASAAIYFVSGPTVHVAHRNYWRTLASAAGRLSLPLVFAKMGERVMTGDSGGTRADVGAIVGAVVAALCDDLFLAWEQPGQRE